MNAMTSEARPAVTEAVADATALGFARIARLAPRPTDIAATGLPLTFLADLLAKHLASGACSRPVS